MRIVSWSILLVLTLVIVLFAVSNRVIVELAFWPLQGTFAVPLFLPVLACAGVTLLIGIATGWISSGSARKLARRRGARVAELEERNRMLEQRRDSSSRAPSTTPQTPMLRQIPGGRS